MFRKLVNPNQQNSFSNDLRRERFAIFQQLVNESKGATLKILDVGGTEIFWRNMNFLEANPTKSFEITLLNIEPIEISLPNFKSVIGDARCMPEFGDQVFDIVFSNSVIEHVGSIQDQINMANEIRRVSKKYFVQTPNYFFPIEPHFLFPLFQFLPLSLRAWLINHFDLGNTKKIPNKEEAFLYVQSLRLLSRKELTKLFPDANIVSEIFFGLTKSYMCIRH
jgi:hypothetical protein